MGPARGGRGRPDGGQGAARGGRGTAGGRPGMPGAGGLKSARKHRKRHICWGKSLGQRPRQPRKCRMKSIHFHATVSKNSDLAKMNSLFVFLQIRGVSKKWSKVMEGLSNLKRQDWSGAFLEIIGRQKLAYLMEGLLKTGGPVSHNRHQAALPEVSHGPQLGATHPHAPGARMT